MNQLKVMRLVKKEKQPKHRGLLKTDEALRGYQSQYDAMTEKYGLVDDRLPLSRRLMRWIRRIK